MTITVTILAIEKKRLEEYISRTCAYRHTVMNSDKVVCSRHYKDYCNMGMADKIALNCPHDCSHFSESKFKKCDPSKCSLIKRDIKELTKEGGCK